MPQHRRALLEHRGATAQAYTLDAGDVGRTIRVRVTASNSAGRRVHKLDLPARQQIPTQAEITAARGG